MAFFHAASASCWQANDCLPRYQRRFSQTAAPCSPSFASGCVPPPGSLSCGSSSSLLLASLIGAPLPLLRLFCQGLVGLRARFRSTTAPTDPGLTLSPAVTDDERLFLPVWRACPQVLNPARPLHCSWFSYCCCHPMDAGTAAHLHHGQHPWFHILARSSRRAVHESNPGRFSPASEAHVSNTRSDQHACGYTYVPIALRPAGLSPHRSSSDQARPSHLRRVPNRPHAGGLH